MTERKYTNLEYCENECSEWRGITKTGYTCRRCMFAALVEARESITNLTKIACDQKEEIAEQIKVKDHWYKVSHDLGAEIARLKESTCKNCGSCWFHEREGN